MNKLKEYESPEIEIEKFTFENCTIFTSEDGQESGDNSGEIPF